MATHLKSESEPRQRSFEMVRIIDQNRCLGDRHVLLQFAEKHYGKLRRSSRKEPNVEEFIRLGIDGTVQSAVVAVNADHFLVNRELIRTYRRNRL